MEFDAKTRRTDGGDEIDRLSNLPSNVTDRVLAYMPVHDIARTSVLSKTWKDVWRMHPVLVFNDEFFSQFVGDRDVKREIQARLSKASRTITSILSLHRGPILKFHLSIPSDFPCGPRQTNQIHRMNLWMQNLSDNDIRELEIFSKTLAPYRMSAYLFSCVRLSHLTLSNCILSPPNTFEGFHDLISVKLICVVITAGISLGTKLDQLILERCTGIEHLGPNNNLSMLMITDSRDLDWELFECTKKSQLTSLMLTGVSNSRKKIINLDKLVSNMPRINSLLFDDHFFKVLEPGANILERPITTMENLNFLSFECVGFHDLVQIQCVLDLIRRSPNLQFLMIELRPIVKNMDGVEVVSSIEQDLQLPSFIDMILYQLKTVEMQNIGGSGAELQFIQYLLAFSPSLEWLTYTLDATIGDPREKLKICQKIKMLHCASPAAQIIWK